MFVTDRESIWDNGSRRRWASLASFAFEIALAAGLLLMSLTEPQGPPLVRPLESTPLLPVPAGGRPMAREHPKSSLAIRPIGEFVLASRHVPLEMPELTAGDDGPPPPDFMGGNQTEGGSGSSNLGDVLTRGLGTGPSLATSNPPPSNHLPRISQSMEGSLIQRVQPEYPPLAKQARIQGTVWLHAVIDREGKIKNLQVLSGHPLLVEAARKAVEQWRYRPYFLNGQPVEVETEITVHFTLSGG